jgi:hypothetical protein
MRCDNVWVPEIEISSGQAIEDAGVSRATGAAVRSPGFGAIWYTRARE